MLKWIVDRFQGQQRETEPQVRKVSESMGAKVWFSPQSAEVLLSTRPRKQALQQLWDCSPFSRPVWEAFWLEPVKRLAVSLQQLPAASSGPYAREGGMLDEALEVAVCAVRLSRGWMLPPGAPPEEQSAQSAAWCTAIFWAALMHDMGSLEQMAAFYEDGRQWFPGLGMPEAPWQMKFCKQETNSAVRAATSAYRLLPYEGLIWIARWPSLVDALLVYLSGNKPAGTILHAAVSEAREKCRLFAQDTSAQLSVKLATDNTKALSQSAPSVPAEHLTIEIPVQPFVSNEIDDNKISSLCSADVLSVMPELVSAIGQSRPADNLADEGADMPSEGGTPGDLLTLLDKMTSAEAADGTVSADNSTVETLTQSAVARTPTLGELFWDWLVDSIEEGTLSVNTQDSLLHVMAQYVFIPTPDCFYRYLAVQENIKADKNEIQKSFEALNKHFSRSGKGIYIYKKYKREGREGRFTRISGYMILASQLFKQDIELSDSAWLSPNR
ncbi:TraI domain-containing protein [Rahnella aceris]|uniref:TraI domain-containing protein n=1 Tax=Rahnella sp. (strain Y9602) TaxID=2703885 RepID=UPI001C271564|nr:TraI domain-containing protein [Rahnella aceris]MBU9839027.1 TraI domain-containing protein [Rahnella aceris]